jgi:hypothetical protein
MAKRKVELAAKWAQSHEEAIAYGESEQCRASEEAWLENMRRLPRNKKDGTVDLRSPKVQAEELAYCKKRLQAKRLRKQQANHSSNAADQEEALVRLKRQKKIEEDEEEERMIELALNGGKPFPPQKPLLPGSYFVREDYRDKEDYAIQHGFRDNEKVYDEYMLADTPEWEYAVLERYHHDHEGDDGLNNHKRYHHLPIPTGYEHTNTASYSQQNHVQEYDNTHHVYHHHR